MATSPSSKQQSGLSKYGDLKGRLIFLALALVVYRIGAHVPVPGIDPDMLNQLFNQQQGGILGLFNMFSGGALSGSCRTFQHPLFSRCCRTCSRRLKRFAKRENKAAERSRSTPATGHLRLVYSKALASPLR